MGKWGNLGDGGALLVSLSNALLEPHQRLMHYITSQSPKPSTVAARGSTWMRIRNCCYKVWIAQV